MSHNVFVQNDIGCLEFDKRGCPTIINTLRIQVVKNGPDVLQNQDKILAAPLHRDRRLTKSF